MRTPFEVGKVCGLLKAAMFLLDHNGQPYQRVGEALKLFEFGPEGFWQDDIQSLALLNNIKVQAQSKLLDAISELRASDTISLELSKAYELSFSGTQVPVIIIIAFAADHISRLGTQ